MNDNGLVESQASFVDYLNNEIDQIREDIKMPGWTNWAVMAALASIGWFLILEIEKNIFKVEQIYLLYIIISLAYMILREFYDWFKPNQSNKRVRYFTVDVLFRERRLAMVINFIQICLMIILIVHFSTQVGMLPYYLALLHYGMFLVSPVLVPILINSMKRITSTNFYIPDPENYSIVFGVPLSKRNSKMRMNFYMLPSTVMIILVSYLLVAYSLLYFNLFGIVFSGFAFSSIKIAILVFAIFPLLKLLVYSEQTSPTLKELASIRRDLMFGNINLDMAKKLAEISISGLNKSAIVQREIANCIITLQGISTELNKAAQKNQIASSQLQNKMDSENLEAQQALWETIRDATLAHFRQARKIYLSDKSLRGGLTLFLRFYSSIEPDDTDFITSLQKMSDLYIDVKKKYDRTIYEWLNLVERYDGNSASSNWRDIAIKELAAELPQDRMVEQEAG